MIERATYSQLYTCGQHVSGRGKQTATRSGTPMSPQPGQELVIVNGTVVSLPAKRGDPYTVLDGVTFIVLEVNEEDLTPLP
ncbi:MAG: hypothetical protein L0Y80_04815 [Ignavibacteriae bacterium]|nr:hypothetical protein [Ignavibacteriota bacterium]